MSSPTIPDEGWPPHTELEPEDHPKRIVWRGAAQVYTLKHGAARRNFIEQGRKTLWALWFTTREYYMEQRVAELEREIRELTCSLDGYVEFEHECERCDVTETHEWDGPTFHTPPLPPRWELRGTDKICPWCANNEGLTDEGR